MNDQSKFVSVVIPESQQRRFDDALSDAACWLNGYVSGGGTYSPQTLPVLNEIRATILQAYHTIAPKQSTVPVGDLVANNPSWDCPHCGQKNSGGSKECGRCEKTRRLVAKDFIDVIKDIRGSLAFHFKTNPTIRTKISLEIAELLLKKAAEQDFEE
jgi:hypothetical protein